MLGPNQPASHELGIQQELPCRKFRLGDDAVMVRCDVAAHGVTAALLGSIVACRLGEVVAHGLHRMRRIHTGREGAITQLAARPPEAPQVGGKRLVDGVAQGDFHGTHQRVQRAADVRVPEVHAHQFHVRWPGGKRSGSC